MSTTHLDELRELVATSCRILAREGLVEGILGHVSARVDGTRMLVRCRGPAERGLHATDAGDVRLADLDGRGDEIEQGWKVPAELAIHAEVYRARPDARAVVHAHPPAALLAGLAGLEPRPVFGAFNIPAMRLALGGVPRYPRSVLITRAELAREMLACMDARDVCLLVGHGITAVGESVEQATVRAVNLNVLLSVTVALARLGASPPDVPPEDLAELPDLGGRFNDELVWRALADRAGS
jgi:ribulose-5-phosphate 4-epimerase/fuculose-1-phosphate aldolase